MALNQTQQARLERLIAAFQADGLRIDPLNDVFDYNGKIGLRATHPTATIGTTGVKKKAYYVEGDHYEMGYLLGLMAEPEIGRMCTEFTKLVIFAFIGANIKRIKPLAWLVGLLLEVITYWISGNSYLDIPARYKRELEGILVGCQTANPNTQVTWGDLWVLNFGIDALLSFVYTGGSSPVGKQPKATSFKMPVVKKTLWGIGPKHLRVPFMCNGFSVFGEDYHYFGRDFMFSSAGVFQDTACLIIQRPEPVQTPQGAEGGLPFVSMTAPGIIGTVAGMNSYGVGVGVDMAPAGNCNPAKAGFNSLLLARHSIENGRSCDEAVDVMANSHRGVSWIYILADGTHQKACVVEAAYTAPRLDPLVYPPSQLKDYLPDYSFLGAHPHPPADVRNGLMVRWNTYEYPRAYLEFNAKLFEAAGKPYDPDQVAAAATIGEPWKDKKWPSFDYFQPPGEQNPNLVLATNSFIIPEMRLCAMYEWTSQLAQSHADDIQWRYDELHRQLASTLGKNGGRMSYAEAKKIIDFLAPDGAFPSYYNPDRKPLNEVVIQGSVSLMDLKNKTIESHYGYYADEWVKISLPNYLVD